MSRRLSKTNTEQKILKKSIAYDKNQVFNGPPDEHPDGTRHAGNGDTEERKLISFDIDDTTIRTSLHGSQLNPHLLPLFYFCQAIAEEQNIPFTCFFSTHRNPITEQLLAAQYCDGYAGTVEKWIAIKETRLITLENIKNDLYAQGISKFLFACGSKNSPKISDQQEIINETKIVISELAKTSGKPFTTQTEETKAKYLKEFGKESDQPIVPLSLSKKAHIDFAIEKYKQQHAYSENEI
ncbi:MAG: hypothetical protein JSR33_12210, partial [Proteobacteria bacterium]|nr:hypothetical protein [Pseudomonadota bacterium]